MARIVTLDVETQKSLNEVAGRRMEDLGVSYVGIYSPEEGAQGFFEAEIAGLWPILERADRIVGYNIDRFDMPVLSPYYSGKITALPTFDLLEAVRRSLGFRVSLDKVALATLGEGKNGSGWDALRWYAEGKFEKIRKYCDQDVKVTWKLYLYAQHYGKLKYTDDSGNVTEFGVEISPIERDEEQGTQTTLAI